MSCARKAIGMAKPRQAFDFGVYFRVIRGTLRVIEFGVTRTWLLQPAMSSGLR